MSHERIPVAKQAKAHADKVRKGNDVGLGSAHIADHRPPPLQLNAIAQGSPRHAQHKALADQIRGNQTGLPTSLKAGIESLSGMDMSHVRVHYNSSRPAQLQAHAYAQGSEIHLAPGQERHLPHEAWHVVQQAQGRVQATAQMKGEVPVNDDVGLEGEADTMGEEALKHGDALVQRRADGVDYGRGRRVVAANSVTIQKTKLKNTVGTLGGATALGLAGAAIGSVVPVIGTAIGGAVGAVVGGIGGYLASKPTIYENSQKANYANELATFHAFQLQLQQQQAAVSAYASGTIITYSTATSAAFNALLHEGNVLYTYDKNSVLRIGSNAGPIKHAIVAGNESVKAAGHAHVRRSQANINYGNAVDYQEKIVRFTALRDQHQVAALAVSGRYPDMSLEDVARQPDVTGQEKADVQAYRTGLEQIEEWSGQLAELDADRQPLAVSKANEVMLDNESGHYHPGKSSKDEAFEGWHNAGYPNTSWTSHGE
ncbi:hypothetical protein PAQ31011_00388 [Pandoraea aquatica]|uniref:eCIS core domain-containing protein n=1 Tax=Pandoraea aquatica TaxID=2508290 RepID=A0A5E4RY47_9BURK|nr:DUF4157 domain-containing protein [Pandoraea aquatica]VVD66799.1 hypothetical protein PAQ31011_00388 [Pandoraea aquatica]